MVEAVYTPTPGLVQATGLQYIEVGAGPAVVFLHGLAAFKEIWWGTLLAFAPSFRAVAFDWPRRGRLPATDASSLDGLAESIAQSCAELGLERVTVVGHSLGGNVAARLALMQPDLVERLVLVSAALDTKHLAPRSSLYAHPRYGQRMWHLSGRVLRPVARFGRRVPHNHKGGLLGPLMRRMHYAVDIEPLLLYDYARALWQSSLGERIRDIQQPTLVLTGARDPLVSPRQAREAAALMPNAELCILPGALHNPMDERPHAFQQALLSYLLPTTSPT